MFSGVQCLSFAKSVWCQFFLWHLIWISTVFSWILGLFQHFCFTCHVDIFSFNAAEIVPCLNVCSGSFTDCWHHPIHETLYSGVFLNLWVDFDAQEGPVNVCFNAQTYGVDVAFDPQTQAGLPDNRWDPKSFSIHTWRTNKWTCDCWKQTLVKGHLQCQGFSWSLGNRKEVNHFIWQWLQLLTCQVLQVLTMYVNM